MFGVGDINELPVKIDMAWYDQKAIAIFLSLLYLGIKKIKIGPTLPDYVKQYILNKISGKFEITTVSEE